MNAYQEAYHRAYLLEAKRLRILAACGFDRRQAAAVERLLRGRKLWPSS